MRKAHTPTRVWLYDTTLRDGTQGEGVSFSADDKLRIARKLDELGVHYIEGGWPGSNPKDATFFERAKKELHLQNARLAAFGSTRRVNLAVEKDPQVQMLLEAETPVVTIFGKTWDLHVHHVLRTTLEENLRMIADTIRYLKQHGKEVIYDPEHFFDGWKANREYALDTLKAAADAGADVLVLCDTNGGTMPWEIEEAVLDVQNELPGVPLGIHAHNDSDVGVANTLYAVRAGCVHVQGTVNGYGERCGNANLISIIANLKLKMGIDVVSDEQLRKLTEVSRFVSELANLPPNTRQPFVGASAFAHKGGTHVNAVVKYEMSYQHIDPTLVGNRKRVLVSELSGKDNIAVKRREFGLEGLTREQERAVLQRIKELENQGYVFESAEASVAVLLNRVRNGYTPPFELIDYTVLVEHRQGRGMVCEATVKVRIGDEVYHTAAEGNGPVHALDNALRKALLQFYPELESVQLTDYKVRILNPHAATAATVRVLIDSADGRQRWTTVGVSPNIIEASWLALTDSVEFALMPKTQEQAEKSS
ncbi:MAG: citramalate synthase [Chloroflexi bacterium]|nr:citramalate synthase [Chloroflexota bacterium]